MNRLWQPALVWIAHVAAALILVLEFVSPAWSQGRDPFRPMPDPRQEARDPREVGNRDFARREFDPRRSAEDPRRAGNRKPLAAGRDLREVARDTVRPAVDDVPLPRLPAPAEVELERLDDVRAVELGLQFTDSGGDTILIERVAQRGVMARAGFRPGDRIVSVNNLKVTREADFLRYLLAEETRDEQFPIVVIRNDLKETLQVEPALLVAELTRVRRDPLVDFGLRVVSHDERLVVRSVVRRSPAQIAGLRPGDVILTFDDQSPLTPEDLAAWIEAAGPDPVMVTVQRGEVVVPLQWENDIIMDATNSPSTGTTVIDRKRLERMSQLRERREMRR